MVIEFETDDEMPVFYRLLLQHKGLRGDRGVLQGTTRANFPAVIDIMMVHRIKIHQNLNLH